eukprot:5868153-Prymnesium_polylepis.1
MNTLNWEKLPTYKANKTIFVRARRPSSARTRRDARRRSGSAHNVSAPPFARSAHAHPGLARPARAGHRQGGARARVGACLLYTSDAADDM